MKGDLRTVKFKVRFVLQNPWMEQKNKIIFCGKETIERTIGLQESAEKRNFVKTFRKTSFCHKTTSRLGFVLFFEDIDNLYNGISSILTQKQEAGKVAVYPMMTSLLYLVSF